VHIFIKQCLLLSLARAGDVMVRVSYLDQVVAGSTASLSRNDPRQVVQTHCASVTKQCH